MAHLASHRHVEPPLHAVRGFLVRDALLHCARPRILSCIDREDSMGPLPHFVFEVAPRSFDRARADRRRALFPAPVVSGRPLLADQGQARSALVQPESHDPVLSVGDPGWVGAYHRRTLSFDPLAGCEDRSANSDGSKPRDRALAGNLRDLPRRRPVKEWRAAVPLDVARRNPFFLAGDWLAG